MISALLVVSLIIPCFQTAFSLQAAHHCSSKGSQLLDQRHSHHLLLSTRSNDNIPETTTSNSCSNLVDLKVAIVGGGPSGLLLANKLLANGASVSVYEARSRPISKEPRAYALGVGMRGRTAIKSVDGKLWESVQAAGFASERFHLHIGPLRLRIRDGQDKNNDKATNIQPDQEPSLLLYQSDLCRVLADELVRRWSDDNLSLRFDSKIENVYLHNSSLLLENSLAESFDLIVGCDGVNSIVRSTIQNEWPAFESEKKVLPGELKVMRLSQVPPKLDPTAVSLLLPRAGSVTAFVEPTADGGCCVLFAGRNATDTLLMSQNETELEEVILERFPLFDGAPVAAATHQLAASKTSNAASVTCNIYHCSHVAALVGDAAHATGGVSGQGVNSALMDSSVLADCLLLHYNPTEKTKSLHNALLSYSTKQVPEGKALFDLSFGPKPNTIWKKASYSLNNLLDSVFRGRWGIGKPPLQTQLTTSLIPFSEIRRQNDRYYSEKFPEQEDWNHILTELDARSVPGLASMEEPTVWCGDALQVE